MSKKKEFCFNASIFNLGAFVLLIFSSLILTGLIVYILISVFEYRVSFRLSVVFLLLFVTLLRYFGKYKLKIIIDKQQLFIYRNNKQLYSKNIDEIEKIISSDVDNYSNKMGVLYFVFTGGKKFVFNIALSTGLKEKTIQTQGPQIRSIVKCFIKQYGFVKQIHTTALGKNKYRYNYVNPLYLEKENSQE